MISRRIFASILSIAMVMGLCACKNDEISEYSELMTEKDVEILTGIDEDESEDAEEETESDDVGTTTTVTSMSSTPASKTTTVSVSTAKTTSSRSKKAATTTYRTINVGANRNNGNNSNNGNSKSTKPAETTAVNITTSMVITTVTEPVAPEDVDKYVDFSTVSSGDGYTFDGSTLSIFSPGTYHLSGELLGMVYINVGNEDKVKLRLNGVGIENTGAPCIQVDNADKVVVNAVSGSSNYLKSYSTNAENDAALFSKDDLKIKGEGSLYVFCDNEHGIACNNDLEIEECQLTVDAEKTGISSHKTINILSGNINTNGDNCGIRCRDYIEIAGGYVSACGGKKIGADRGGIISDTGNFCISGGTVIAVGMNQTIPYGQTSAVFSFPTVIPKDNVIGVSIAGTSIASVQPNKKFSCVLVSDLNLYDGAVCDVWLGDTLYDNFTLSGAVTQAALDGVI